MVLAFKKALHSRCKPGVEGYLIQPAHMDYAPYLLKSLILDKTNIC